MAIRSFRMLYSFYLLELARKIANDAAIPNIVNIKSWGLCKWLFVPILFVITPKVNTPIEQKSIVIAAVNTEEFRRIKLPIMMNPKVAAYPLMVILSVDP